MFKFANLSCINCWVFTLLEKWGSARGRVSPLNLLRGYTAPRFGAHNRFAVCYRSVMKKEIWKSTGTAVYNINYHFVWSTKQRRKVLLPPTDETLKGALTTLCKEHGYQLLALEVMPDRVHVFL